MFAVPHACGDSQGDTCSSCEFRQPGAGFVIEKALSFPDVELRFRKEGQKKYRWETYTNSRGEFAVRVPQGSSYEILVHVKGFADQTRTVDAKGGGNEETVVFRMQPVTGETK